MALAIRTKRLGNIAGALNRLWKRVESFGGSIRYIAKRDKKTTGVSLPHSESKLDHDTPGMLNEKNGASQNDESFDLFSASSQGKLEVIEQLLEGGTPVDMQDGDGVSALMHACANGQTEAAKLLLERGAQVDLLDDEEMCALVTASLLGHAELVKLLLEKGAQVDLQNSNGVSALMWASMTGQTEVAKLLLERGAQVDLQDDDGMSALVWANTNLEQFFEKVLLNYYAMDFWSLTMRKAINHRNHRRTEVVKLLLERGAQVDLQDNNGQSPLMWASNMGQTEVVKLLLERGAQVDLRDNNGDSAPMLAFQSGHIETVKFLQKEGVQITYEVTKATHCLEESYPVPPGIVLDQEMITQEEVAFEEVILNGMGIRMYIPEDSLSDGEEPVTLLVHPCFTGPFELPDDFESASPAYLIKSNRRVKFQRDVTLEIHHYARLESEEDCEDMVFLSASTTPEFRESGPVYVFKEIEGTKGVFKPGYQVGEITLRHFCLKMAGKRKRTSQPSESKKSKGNTFYYSARLYRSLSHNSAIFCMCLYSEVYTKHCDKVMEKTGEDWKVNAVASQLISEEVSLSVADGMGWKVIFEKEPNKISKREIHLPEQLHRDISECPDYPPRLSIQFLPIQLDPSTERSNPIKLRVDGLDMECYFNVIVPSAQSSISPPSVATTSFPIKDPPEPHQPLWSQDEPTLSETFRILFPIACEWENIGTLLRISPDQLSNIGHDYNRARDCLREMVKLWLKQVTICPTWQSLADAVSVFDPKIALQISETYCTKRSH